MLWMVVLKNLPILGNDGLNATRSHVTRTQEVNTKNRDLSTDAIR
jgi:hypothetical protein